jgi:Flp pilus assembly protein TadG
MKTKGQALVEMAIVILLLFLLVFGIFQFGWLMYIKNTLNNAARAAVRAAVVTPSLNDKDYGSFSTRDGSDQVQQKIFDSLYYIVDKSAVSANIRIIDKDNNTHNPATPGDTVKVNITLSDVPSFVAGLITVPNTLSGQASMRYE